MRGLKSIIASILTIYISAIGAEKKMGFNLPTYPQTDKALGSIQYFLFFHAFLELDEAQKGECSFSYHPEGRLFVHGHEDEIEGCVVAFGTTLEKVVSGGIPHELFSVSKEAYLDFLKGEGEMDEHSFAENIEFSHLSTIEETLFSLPIMMQNMLPDTIHFEGDELNHDESIGISDASPHLFYDLRLTLDDQKHITTLIKHLGDNGWFALWKERKDLKKIGKKVTPVHPLRFMGFILSIPTLKKRMPKVMGDMFKRKNFLNGDGDDEGFGQRMTREAHNGNLMQYVPGFAESIGVKQESIIKYFKAHDWEGLIRHLM